MVLHLGPHRTQAGFGRGNHLAAAGLHDSRRGHGCFGMAGPRETYPAARRRTEPAPACLCTLGQNPDPDTGVPLGTRTTAHPEPALAAATALPADDGEGSRQSAHDDCKRRHPGTCRKAVAVHSRSRCGVLRTLGRPEPGQEPRGIRDEPADTGETGLHAPETERRDARRTDATLLLPDGHRGMAAE